MTRYRKIPVEIQAWQARDLISMVATNRPPPPSEVKAAMDAGIMEFRRPEILIRTLEGDMKATGSDWIIMGIEGEFYPCKNSIFLSSYEDVKGGD